MPLDLEKMMSSKLFMAFPALNSRDGTTGGHQGGHDVIMDGTPY